MRPSLIALFLLLTGCGQDSLTPPNGVVRLRVQLAPGGTANAAEFWVHMTPYPSILISKHGVDQTYPRVPDGTIATISGGSLWCQATPDSQSVELTSEETGEVLFEVACDTLFSTLRVVIQTIAIDADADGYELTVDGHPHPVAATETTYVHGVAWGPTSLSLGGFAPWCSTPLPDRSIPFSSTDTATVIFPVSCGAEWYQARILGGFLGTPNAGAMIFARTDSGGPFALAPGDTVLRWFRYGLPYVYVDSTSLGCRKLGPGTQPVPTPATSANPTVTVDAGCGQVIVFGQFLGLDDIYTMRRYTVGLDDRVVTMTGGPMPHAGFARLSPDGTRLLSVASHPAPNSPPFNTRWAVLLQPTGGGTADTVHDAVADSLWWDPAWTPDGAHLSFLGLSTGGLPPAIHFLSDTTGQQLDTLVLPPGAGGGVVWAPNGSDVAFPIQFNASSTNDIMIGTIGSTVPVKTLPVGPNPLYLAWSPGGTRIVFSRLGQGLWVVNVATGAILRLTTPPACTADLAPEWSPDGALIIFRRVRQGCGENLSNIGVVRSDGSAPPFLLTSQRISEGPYWER